MKTKSLSQTSWFTKQWQNLIWSQNYLSQVDFESPVSEKIWLKKLWKRKRSFSSVSQTLWQHMGNYDRILMYKSGWRGTKRDTERNCFHLWSISWDVVSRKFELDQVSAIICTRLLRSDEPAFRESKFYRFDMALCNYITILWITGC